MQNSLKGLSIKQFFYLSVLGLSVGCSTQKNTALTRFYHQLNAHYNVYFNARESVKEGLNRVEELLIEDYTQILPIFPETNPMSARMAVSEMEYAVQKCQKLIATHSISKSPKRKTNTSEAYTAFAYKSEYNKWVDDTYLLMGEASYFLRDFHTAQESFNFILYNFPDQPTRNPAFLWLSRCYIDNGEFDKALQILKVLERDGSLPPDIKKDLTVIKADYFMATGNWKEAIFQLELSLKLDLSKKEKGRYNFILGQLYLRQGQTEEAVAAFNRVVKSKPTFRLAFEAKISLLEYSKSNPEEIDRALAKMIRNANNLPYLDRIYYAKGDIALKSDRREDAIRDFQTSVAYSISNDNQRALSSLTVANLFFDEGSYKLSSCYYDSAMAVIGPEYPRYEEIINKANGLTGLLRNLDLISREDSLQQLALMAEPDRLAMIDNIIARITEEENLVLREQQDEQNSQNYFRGQKYRTAAIGNQANNSMWYFYNPVTAGLGKTEFQQIWGKRKLEDNWRRKNKISLNQAEGDQTEATADQLINEAAKPKKSDPKSVEYYLQDLPLTDSLMQASHDRIKSAFFSAGRIYVSILKDEARAIELFEELNDRYPESIYELPTWIELHKIKYNTELFRGKITQKYPESNYAKFLLNPDFFKEMEVMKQLRERKYGEALAFYKKGDYQSAGKLAGEVMKLQPDSLLMPKVKFIELVGKGKNSSAEEFTKMLDQYLADFPGSPANPTVLRIRDLVRQNSLAELEKTIARMDSAAINKQTSLQSGKPNDPFGGKYSYDEELFHYFILSFPRDAKVDINRLIFDIANFNIDFYTSFDFEVEEIKLNDQTTLVVVRSLPNKEEGLGYFGNILRQKQVFKSLQGIDYHYFIASSPNYRKIVADQDLLEYLNFFVLNYSKVSSPSK